MNHVHCICSSYIAKTSFIRIVLSFSTIGIHDYNVVFKTCKPFAARWELLATHLNISRESVEEIGRDGHDVADCLQKLLSVWLKRESFDQSLPSWRVLCEAIQELDRQFQRE